MGVGNNNGEVTLYKCKSKTTKHFRTKYPILIHCTYTFSYLGSKFSTFPSFLLEILIGDIHWLFPKFIFIIMRNVYTGNTTFLKTDALKAQQMHFQWTQQFAVQAHYLLTSLRCPSCSMVTTPGSARVEVSPRSSSSLAIFRKTRRIILPERVFGRLGAS